jgi:hypothetical protein
VVSFTPRPLYPQEKSLWYPLDRRLGGPQSRSGRRGGEKNSQPPPGIEPYYPDRPARSPALYRLSYHGSSSSSSSSSSSITYSVKLLLYEFYEGVLYSTLKTLVLITVHLSCPMGYSVTLDVDFVIIDAEYRRTPFLCIKEASSPNVKISESGIKIHRYAIIVLQVPPPPNFRLFALHLSFVGRIWSTNPQLTDLELRILVERVNNDCAGRDVSQTLATSAPRNLKYLRSSEPRF